MKLRYYRLSATECWKKLRTHKPDIGFWLFLVVVANGLVIFFKVVEYAGSWEIASAIGDTSNVVSAYFAMAAFMGVYIAIRIQRSELRVQQLGLKETREMLKIQADSSMLSSYLAALSAAGQMPVSPNMEREQREAYEQTTRILALLELKSRDILKRTIVHPHQHESLALYLDDVANTFRRATTNALIGQSNPSITIRKAAGQAAKEIDMSKLAVDSQATIPLNRSLNALRDISNYEWDDSTQDALAKSKKDLSDLTDIAYRQISIYSELCENNY